MRIQDRPLRRFANSEDNQSLYSELSSSILFWNSRSYPFQNIAVTRSDSARYRQEAYVPTLVTDPSGKPGALGLTSFITFTYDVGQTYNDASISFWIKGLNSASPLTVLLTDNDSFVQLSNTELSITIDGNISVFLLNTPMVDWDHFVLI